MAGVHNRERTGSSAWAGSCRACGQEGARVLRSSLAADARYEPRNTGVGGFCRCDRDGDRRGVSGEPATRERVHTSTEWKTDLSAAVEVMAGLTAVDGATVITNTYELIAFGAKTAPREGHLRVEQVAVTESIEDGLSVVVHPTRLGGTRHFSAVQFVSEQRDALALVASQDGRFTVFSWSPAEAMVRAHRVEALLM